MTGSPYLRQYVTVNPGSIKQQNQRAVLAHLHSLGLLSVADLAFLLNLSKTTISKILVSLCNGGAVVSAGKGASTFSGGKKPELFRLKANYKFIIVLYAHGNYFEIAVLNFDSKILYRASEPGLTFTSYSEALEIAVKMINSTIKELKIEPENLYNITVIGTGLIDSKYGVLHYSIEHNWPQDIKVVDDLILKVSTPPESVSFISAREATGYAELLSSANFTLNKIILVTSDMRCGGSILSNHEVQNGSNGLLGEFGHMILDPSSDIVCSCGNRGCFDSLIKEDTLLASAYNLAAEYPDSLINEKIYAGTLTVDDIFLAFSLEDPLGVAMLDKMADWFYYFIHNMIIVHEPDKIIIQGLYTKGGQKFLNLLHKKIKTCPFYGVTRSVGLTFAQYPAEDAPFIGAAHLATHKFIDYGELSAFE